MVVVLKETGTTHLFASFTDLIASAADLIDEISIADSFLGVVDDESDLALAYVALRSAGDVIGRKILGRHSPHKKRNTKSAIRSKNQPKSISMRYEKTDKLPDYEHIVINESLVDIGFSDETCIPNIILFGDTKLFAYSRPTEEREID